MLKPRRYNQGPILITLFFLSISLVSAAWYCKDPECSKPVSGGRTTHAYNPTVNAILNGYLAVEPFQETTNYKISNEPYIYEVEVNGKRGFLPRSLVEIVADHVGNDEYSVVEGPSAPNEDDPYVEKGSPVLNDVETQKSVPIPKAVVEPTTEANQIPINEDLTATEKEAPKIPASDIEKSEEKKVDEKLQSLPVEEERKVTDTPPPVVQAPDAVKDSKPILSENPPKEQPKTHVEPSAPEKPIRPTIPALGTLVDEEQEIEVALDHVTDVVKEEQALDLNEINSNIEISDVNKLTDAVVNTVDSSVTKQLVNEKPETLVVAPVVEQKAVPEKEVIGKPADSPKPSVEQHVNLMENAKDIVADAKQSVTPELHVAPSDVTSNGPPPTDVKIIKDIVVESSTIAPSSPVKEAAPPVPLNSVVIEKPAESIKMPEPKVTFQQTNLYAGLPQYNIGEPRPQVFTTKVHNRFDHHHHHHHGPHDHHHHGADSHEHHDHPAHSHALEKPDRQADQANLRLDLGPHKHGNGEVEHGHRHDHDDHNHHQHHDHGTHSHAQVLQKPSESEKPDLGRGETQGKSEIHDHSHEKHGHDHDHAHHHFHTTPTPVESPKDVHVAITDDKVAALAPNANITFIEPELATHAPVNYTQIVLDRLEGKTVPGYLDEHLDKEPSAGYPIPPPLDPATATEAPRIPGPGVLPESEIEVAIESIDRYHRGGRRSHRDGSRRVGPGVSDEVHDHKHIENQDHGHHGGDHSHHGHDHSDHDHSDHEHVHDHSEHGLSGGTPSVEVPVIGSCAARKSGDVHVTGDVPCEDVIEALTEKSEILEEASDEVEENGPTGIQVHLQHAVVILAKAWLFLIIEFEKISAGFRLSGMFILALSTVVFMMVAASDRGIRKAMERGFEEYDHKKETELLTLRNQVQTLLKQNQELGTTNVVLPTPAMVRTPLDAPVGHCKDCDGLRANLVEMERTIKDNDRLVKEQRESQAGLVHRNEEIMMQLQSAMKEREDLIKDVENTRQRLNDTEKRLFSPSNSTGIDSQREQELAFVRQRLEQLEAENGTLKMANQQAVYAASETSNRNMTLQTERDESNSNIRLLKELLTEKEEEIRKMRSAEAAGGSANMRELAEKTDELRSQKKQVARLHEELETMKRERESQLQVRCQSFRVAADKAQRDALMARQETIIVRQQLDELCRKYGEQMPVIVMPQMANGAMTPPGSQMLFSGLAYPPGPPPPTFEAFKQHVLSQGNSSGHTSPRSPNLEREWQRDKGPVKRSSKTHDHSRNGKSAQYDDSDDEKRKDKSKR